MKKKEIPRYTGEVELYFPEFKKIVKKGDLLPELPIEEAERRSDFEIVKSDNEKEGLNGRSKK